jgi:hypothetical protein
LEDAVMAFEVGLRWMGRSVKLSVSSILDMGDCYAQLVRMI